MSAASISAPQEAPLLPTRLRNARALWVVLIIMALLAGCALLFARGSMRLSGDWQSQLSNTLTVQVILESAEAWTEQTDIARHALTEALPGVDVDVLPQSEARELLQPWLGNAALPDNLPVPAGTLLLILLAGLSVNIFATRAAMTSQKDIIRVLVQVGASDKFIARLFIGQAFRRGAIGALLGLGIAALLWLVLSVTSDWGGLGWAAVSSGVVDVFWLIGLGALFALICAAAAGMTSVRQLAFERKRL